MSIEKICPYCKTSFKGRVDKIYCSPKCRRKTFYNLKRKESIEYAKKWQKEHPKHHKEYNKKYRSTLGKEIKEKYRKTAKDKCRINILWTLDDSGIYVTKKVVKRPRPIDNKCEICGKLHGSGRLDYHHWGEIEEPPKITLGVWVGNKCHRIIEGINKGLTFKNQFQYCLEIYATFLKKKEEIECIYQSPV